MRGKPGPRRSAEVKVLERLEVLYWLYKTRRGLIRQSPSGTT